MYNSSHHAAQYRVLSATTDRFGPPRLPPHRSWTFRRPAPGRANRTSGSFVLFHTGRNRYCSPRPPNPLVLRRPPTQKEPSVTAVTSDLPTLPQERPHGRHLGLALVVIATAQLMVVLDATIVNVALPHIQRALGFSGNGLQWVITAYALSFGGLLLLGGRAGDLLGRRRVFMSGLLLFSAASFVGRLRHLPVLAAGGPGVPGGGRGVDRPDRAGPGGHQLRRGAGPQPGPGCSGRHERGGGRGRPGRRRPAHHLPVVAVGAVRQRPHRAAGRRRRPQWCWPNRPAGGAASTWPGPLPAPPELPYWCTACPTPAPINTAYRTGVTPRSSPRWWRRRSCWSAS